MTMVDRGNRRTHPLGMAAPGSVEAGSVGLPLLETFPRTRHGTERGLKYGKTNWVIL